jgi:prevent-host-death family protein
MAKPINIYEAKTRLSQLIEQAENGDEVIIARAGRPVARLVAFRQASITRKPGRLKGRIRIGRTFDDPLPSDLFEGKQ